MGCIFDFIHFSNCFYVPFFWSWKQGGSLDGGWHALVQMVVGLVTAGGWRHPAQALGYAPHVRVHWELQQGRGSALGIWNSMRNRIQTHVPQLFSESCVEIE